MKDEFLEMQEVAKGLYVVNEHPLEGSYDFFASSPLYLKEAEEREDEATPGEPVEMAAEASPAR